MCPELYSAKSRKNSTAEVALLFPCGHYIGSECLSSWLSEEGGITCPAGRARISNGDEDRFVQRLPSWDVLEHTDLYDPTEIMNKENHHRRRQEESRALTKETDSSADAIVSSTEAPKSTQKALDVPELSSRHQRQHS